MIKLIKGSIKKMLCKHIYMLLPDRRTILTSNGKLATRRIHVCVQCGRTKTTTIPR